MIGKRIIAADMLDVESTTGRVMSVASSSIRDQQHPMIRRLANTIEQIWQQRLQLSPYQMPADLGYVEGRLEGERLVIENQCFQTPEFRKLHLELAQVGKNLDILHCVMFPRADYPLPMFGCDLVGGRGKISAAIVDLSPVTRHLSPAYCEALEQLPSPDFRNIRELPEWGSIFSNHCLFIRPDSPEEEARFCDRIAAYLDIHCQQATTTPPQSDRKAEILAGQQRYCDHQRQNDKTRRVLESAFGKAWAERYMTTVLFDLPPLP